MIFAAISGSAGLGLAESAGVPFVQGKLGIGQGCVIIGSRGATPRKERAESQEGQDNCQEFKTQTVFHIKVREATGPKADYSARR